jgi:hypothetical protein
MDSELWRRIQESMGYTDEELKTMMADPQRKKALEAGPLLVRRKIFGEVIHAKNCAAHQWGQNISSEATVCSAPATARTTCASAFWLPWSRHATQYWIG